MPGASPSEADAEMIRLGVISGVHGVNGWIKVFSDTQPRESIFRYTPWILQGLDGAPGVEVLDWRTQGKTLVAKLKGWDTREEARALLGQPISLKMVDLPVLGENEFYWHQLIGMQVISEYSDSPVVLGQVTELMETGSNDVLIVRSDESSHLVPWVLGEFVVGVDAAQGVIRVHWDPDF